MSARRGGVGEQRHLAAVLHGGRDVALVLAAVAAHAAGTDLAAVGDELAQQRRVLVVDVRRLVLAELADLLLGLAQNRLGHCGAPCLTPGPADGRPGMVSLFSVGRDPVRTGARRWPREPGTT